MKGWILTVPAIGDSSVREVNTANIYPLLYDGVKGYIEQVPLFTRFEWSGIMRECVAFCNEEGKIKNLPVNERATAMWIKAANKHVGDVLVGDVLVVWGDKEFMRDL